MGFLGPVTLAAVQITGSTAKIGGAGAGRDVAAAASYLSDTPGVGDAFELALSKGAMQVVGNASVQRQADVPLDPSVAANNTISFNV